MIGCKIFKNKNATGIMHKISVEKPTRLLSHNPVCLVTSKCGETENIFTASWVMNVSSKPSLVALSVGKTRFSLDIIRKSKSFCLNIPDKSMLKEVIYCGNVSGRYKNKFAEMKLEKEITARKNIILPKCIAYLECAVMNEVDAGDHILFIAEIVANGVEAECFDKNTWHISSKSEVLFYLGDGKYCTAKALK